MEINLRLVKVKLSLEIKQCIMLCILNWCGLRCFNPYFSIERKVTPIDIDMAGQFYYTLVGLIGGMGEEALHLEINNMKTLL